MIWFSIIVVALLLVVSVSLVRSRLRKGETIFSAIAQVFLFWAILVIASYLTQN